MKYGNNYERAVFGKNDKILHREHARYSWVKDNVVGNKILEIGCSSGYGTRYLNHIKDLNYLGIDKDEAIIKLATEEFGAGNIKFQVEDAVKKFLFEKTEEKWDTIIVLECIEHIEYGKELIQKLKEHCTCLLASVPYDEPKGYWGSHHVMHNLKEFDFLGFNYKYINYAGQLLDEPDLNFSHSVDEVKKNENLMLMKWEKDVLNTAPKDYKQKLKEGVTAFIPTKDRYNTTLPLAIMSVINQTVKVKKLLIMDDGEKKDLREIPTYSYIFKLLERKGIEWEVAFGNGCGIAHSHQFSVNKCDTEWLWRIDDDCVAESNCLENLLLATKTSKKIGAVGGLVMDPRHPKYHSLASNKIEDIYLGLNEQWYEENNNEIKEVDHLYSSFIYRKEAASHGYNLELSKVGHREETTFTYGMKRNGWKLLLNPAAKTWHFRNPEGGIRAFKDHSLWEHDEKIFQKKLQEWGVKLNNYKLVVADMGLGDHLVLSKVLPDIKKKYGKVILACCYTEVFKDDKDIKIISIAEAHDMCDISNYNIYKFMIDHKWDKSLEEAFRAMYL